MLSKQSFLLKLAMLKQVYGIWEITLSDSSLLVWSQNADNTYEVPKLSNFSMQGYLCAGEA